MRPLSLVVALAATITLATPSPAAASPITSFTSGVSSATFVAGQSVTTPGGGPWNTLTFNLFNTSGAPSAAGDLYLLTQEYLGTPAGLSAATPGFLATTSNVSGGMWLFNPSVTIQSATQYFFYGTALMTVTGANGVGTYTGGALYSGAGGSFFVIPQNDVNFALAGTPTTAAAVPEPASLLLLGTGLAAAVVIRRRRRQ